MYASMNKYIFCSKYFTGIQFNVTFASRFVRIFLYAFFLFVFHSQTRLRAINFLLFAVLFLFFVLNVTTSHRYAYLMQHQQHFKLDKP